MIKFIKQLVEKWSHWLGDHDLEIALRKFLNDEGFYGDSATFRDLKLVAVQRPGWLQVYTFTAMCRSRIASADKPQELFGIARQDERYNRLDLKVFAARHERNSLLEEWSQDLVRLRRSTRQG